MAMEIGVNYPWCNYGWDFGDFPCRETSRPNWKRYILEDLQKFQKLGISVVRWFILGDGLVLGSSREAPHRDKKNPLFWRFDDVPPLSKSFIDDFQSLL